MRGGAKAASFSQSNSAYWLELTLSQGHNGLSAKHSNVENDTNALAEFVDVYPTLADLCGLPLPAHLEGTSLKPVLRNPAKARVKTAAFSQYPRQNASGTRLMGYSMRTDRYRLTRWVHRDEPSKVDAVELYDHQTDPQENTNIAGVAENARLLADLTRKWEAGWRGAARG